MMEFKTGINPNFSSVENNHGALKLLISGMIVFVFISCSAKLRPVESGKDMYYGGYPLNTCSPLSPVKGSIEHPYTMKYYEKKNEKMLKILNSSKAKR